MVAPIRISTYPDYIQNILVWRIVFSRQICINVTHFYLILNLGQTYELHKCFNIFFINLLKFAFKMSHGFLFENRIIFFSFLFIWNIKIIFIDKHVVLLFISTSITTEICIAIFPHIMPKSISVKLCPSGCFECRKWYAYFMRIF